MPISKSEQKKIASMLKEAEESMKWIIENYDRLRTQYGDKWVAVRKGGVLASDPDYEKLVKTLEQTQSETELSRIAVDFISINPPNFLL